MSIAQRPWAAKSGNAAETAVSAAAPDGQIRVLFACDSHEIGGAEVSLGRLLALLSPRITATVLGVNEEIVNWLAAQRLDTMAVTVPRIRSRYHVAAIASHLAAIRRSRPNIMHVSLNRPCGCPFEVLFGLALPGVRVIAVDKLPRPHEHWRHAVFKRASSRFVAAHVTVGPTSALQVAQLAGVSPQSIRVIPSGAIERELKLLPRPAEGPIVGCLARLDRQKGVDVLIEALAHLPDVTAVVVGDGAERGRLEDLAVALGVRSRVIFVGFTEDAQDQLSTFDIFVLPSRFEALGVSIIEAMFAGLPVVSTTAGGIRDAVEHGRTGLLVAPDDALALARAIRDLVDDPARRREMGRAGQDRARAQFTAAKMAAAFESLYLELMPNG